MSKAAERQAGGNARSALGEGAWMRAGVLVLVFAFAYSATLALMGRTWFFSADAYHGALVPFISLYFVWAGRERLMKIPVRPSVIGGAALFVIGNIILLLGRAGSVIMVELFSMVVIIPAIVLMLLGPRFLMALIVPLGYLVLMVPFLDAVDEIHRPFQDMSAAMGVRLLSLLNIPVFLNGLYLELPGIVLEVAVACSGLNFLLSIIAVSVPLAVFTLNRVWQRAALIASGVLIGVVSNWLRITLIGVWTYMGGKGVHGPLHILQGFFVSVIGFIFLFICAWLLGRFNGGESSGDHASGGPACAPFDAGKLNKALIVLVALLLSVKGYQHFMKVVTTPVKASLADMPSTIGDWRSEQREGKAPFELERADSSVSRSYRNGSGRELILYIGYIEKQTQDREVIDYRLRRVYKNNEPVAVNSIPMNRAVLKSGNESYQTLFWYDIGGRVVSGRYEAKLLTALDGLLRRRTNGAIVMIFSRLADGADRDAAFKDEEDFARGLLPELKRYLP